MPSMALRLRVFRDKIEGIIAKVLFFSKGGEGREIILRMLYRYEIRRFVTCEITFPEINEYQKNFRSHDFRNNRREQFEECLFPLRKWK